MSGPVGVPRPRGVPCYLPRVSAGLCDRDCAHTPAGCTLHTLSTAFPFSPPSLPSAFPSLCGLFGLDLPVGEVLGCVSVCCPLCLIPVLDLVTGTGSICGCSVAITPFSLHSWYHPRHNAVDTKRSLPLHLPMRFGVALLPTATHSLRGLELVDVTSLEWPCQPLDALLAHRNTTTTTTADMELAMQFSA